MRRRGLGLALVVLVVYVGALALTVALRDDHVRPLYDGFAPPPSYRWVDPPAFFESGNVEPTSHSATIRFSHGDSAPTGVATPDGQFILNFGRGAIAPRARTNAAMVKLSPIAPSDLARLPAGLRGNGNAYRLQMTYDDGADVARLAHPGSLVLEIPELGDALYFSRDGQQWSKLESRAVPPRQLSLTGAFARPGYYLAGTNLPELVAPASESDHSVAIGIGTAALAAIILVAAFLLVRRRRHRASVNSG